MSTNAIVMHRGPISSLTHGNVDGGAPVTVDVTNRNILAPLDYIVNLGGAAATFNLASFQMAEFSIGPWFTSGEFMNVPFGAVGTVRKSVTNNIWTEHISSGRGNFLRMSLNASGGIFDSEIIIYDVAPGDLLRITTFESDDLAAVVNLLNINAVDGFSDIEFHDWHRRGQEFLAPEVDGDVINVFGRIVPGRININRVKGATLKAPPRFGSLIIEIFMSRYRESIWQEVLSRVIDVLCNDDPFLSYGINVMADTLVPPLQDVERNKDLFPDYYAVSAEVDYQGFGDQVT